MNFHAGKIGFFVALISGMTGSAGAQVSANFPGIDDAHRECDMACLYKKANEHISLDSLYLMKRVMFLEASCKNGCDKDVKDRLGNFCIGTESADTCFKRYKYFVIMQLQKRKAALESNEASAASLLSKSSYTARQMDKNRGAEKSGILPQVTFIPKSKELDAVYRRQFANHKRSHKTDYEGMVDGLRPTKDDFVKFKTVKKEAGLGGSEKTMLVLDKSCGREFCYDEKKYNLALADYTLRRAEIARDLKNAYSQGSTKDGYRTDSSLIEGRERQTADSIEDYSYARDPAVEAANELINKVSKKGDLKVKGPEKKGGARKPSSGRVEESVRQPGGGDTDTFIQVQTELVDKQMKRINKGFKKEDKMKFIEEDGKK
ncbi:MAG: hypothetical protein A2583_03490 [Bdellovibrionales bacterium RIFOXYD1_FULL_53_11]|nr:MAG: hypothetical protein A2583_03490 [Bdellovibrionales bacterium RIFOXYD1_FULL_53_11]